MAFKPEDIKPFSRWYHLKTNSYYQVIGVGRCSTNGNEQEESVIYFSMTGDNKLHYRKVEEFLDGRFEPVGIQGLKYAPPVTWD